MGYYKTLVMNVTDFETIIIDERNFPDKEKATAFARKHGDDHFTMVIAMRRELPVNVGE